MTGAPDGKRDFFISFTGADRRWARWLARTLAEAGYRFWLQDQDFAGSIPRNIEEAHERSGRTILLLSDAYAQSGYCRSEWEMRYQDDPGGEQDLLILLRVSPAAPPPLLRRLAHVDLFGCQDEAVARELVVNRLRQAVEPGTELPLGEALFPGVEAPFPVPKHNLPPANPDFVGREDALAEIRGMLTGGAAATITQASAITGLGGVGKTQTALAYCYRHLADHRLIWWLRAAEPATLATGFASLATPLGLPEEQDQAKLVQAVKARLQVLRDWLLVLDDAEDPAVVRSYLAGTGGGQVLITSRRTDWQGTAVECVLDVMPEPEALRLLAGRPDPEALPAAELAEAKALAAELGHLPLALAQARAYMRETGESFAGYRALLGTSKAELLRKGRAQPEYPEPAARTWDISLRAAEQQYPAARPLLELLAFLAPDALPRAVLDADLHALPEDLRDKLARNDAIGALNSFSLIRAEGGSIAVHHLVQTVTRDGLDEVTAKARVEAVVRLVNAALPSDPQNYANWPRIGVLLPHMLAVSGAAERLQAGPEVTANVLNGTARYHHARVAWTEAEPLYQRALGIREKVLGPEHPDVAQSRNDLALLYRDTGRLAEAEPLFRHTLGTREKALGPEHPDVAQSLNNLAALYRDTGRYAEAKPLFERAMAITEKTLGPEHPDLATRLNNLGMLYAETRRSVRAVPLLRRARAIYEKALGPEHPDLAKVLDNLAGVYRAIGFHGEAKRLQDRISAIRRRSSADGSRRS